jgi:hypothetical protein
MRWYDPFRVIDRVRDYFHPRDSERERPQQGLDETRKLLRDAGAVRCSQISGYGGSGNPITEEALTRLRANTARKKAELSYLDGLRVNGLL